MSIKSEVKAEIIADERIRIQKIVESPEGRAHPKTALTFALNSPMSAELAIETMRPLPHESHFAEAMNREGPIGLHAGSAAAATFATGDDPRAARIAELTAGGKAFNASKGYGKVAR